MDVRDVATAHVLALEDEDAEGRYLLIAQVCVGTLTSLRCLGPHDPRECASTERALAGLCG